MKIKDFMQMMGELSYDEEKTAFYSKSEHEVTDFIHSNTSNFKVGDRVRKINAIETDLYETPDNTKGILLTSVFIDELKKHISLVKFENMEEIVGTSEDSLELINENI